MSDGAHALHPWCVSLPGSWLEPASGFALLPLSCSRVSVQDRDALDGAARLAAELVTGFCICPTAEAGAGSVPGAGPGWNSGFQSW